MRFHILLLVACSIAAAAPAKRVTRDKSAVEADAALEQQAGRLIRRLLAGDSAVPYHVVGECLILGPGLWRALDSTYEGPGCRVASTTFLISPNRRETVVLRGANIRGCQPLAGLLHKLLGAGKPTRISITRLNRRERALHAGLLGNLIRGPALAVEIADEHLVFRHRLLFVFDRTGKSLQLAYLDEFRAYARLQASGELVPQDRREWIEGGRQEGEP